MHQSSLGVLVLFSLIYLCISVHVPFDLNGWKALRLDNNRVQDSTNLAVEHLAGQLKQPITAFKLEENIPNWDLYRVSFIGTYFKGEEYECHSDVVWIFNPFNVTVFNTGCLPTSQLNFKY
ncbi:insoluble matrix shell protein 2 [Ruditapes philippinarum]|uniref:Insoluble matrix shell protein 2 n=1 Tax=Ruditapes philippinarum TaxID=129788 RepID=IMSP2_RUDPH|nr:insoluble matrix shell protein 2 [Ruditapes philippinarum]P86983.1 RecName: Full=Insoluble matrix shell protein 2; Short=IMSP2; Flags: Precursor [Ruditapes philippinarum]